MARRNQPRGGLLVKPISQVLINLRNGRFPVSGVCEQRWLDEPDNLVLSCVKAWAADIWGFQDGDHTLSNTGIKSIECCRTEPPHPRRLLRFGNRGRDYPDGRQAVSTSDDDT
jgi:hypothetical protein